MSEQRDSNAADAAPKQESGVPGGGAGRRDEVGGSGVHPASAGNAPSDAEIRTQAGWGQGERGAAGYEDSGSSEIHPTDEELRSAQRGRSAESGGESGEPTTGS